MNEETFRMFELASQGFGCSQILVEIALEHQKKNNPDLMRAMSGLLGGMGCGRACGALTGACCVLGLYAGKGNQQERADPALAKMLAQLVEWFESEYRPRYGGTNCADIIAGDPQLRQARCPGIVAETFSKLKEILAANDYALDQLRGPASGDVS